jgi:hypothetical protein
VVRDPESRLTLERIRQEGRVRPLRGMRLGGVNSATRSPGVTFTIWHPA